jgi:hypothetical protein
VYQLLTSQEFHNNDVTTDLTWQKQIPLKVFIFVWRLLWNRLTSKDNLVARGIIPLETLHCVICCGGTEIAQHLIILALASVLCGASLGRGLVRQRLICFIYMTISFSLFILQEDREFAVTSRSMFGFAACGCYEMKEIIEYSRTRKVTFTNC